MATQSLMGLNSTNPGSAVPASSVEKCFSDCVLIAGHYALP